MHYYLRTLLILLAVSLPATAWGRSDYHEFSQRMQARLRLKRELERIEKLKPDRTYPYFQLDVF